MTTTATAVDDDNGRASRRDLAGVVLGTILFFALSVTLELSEKVLAWTRPWERFELDEIPGALLFLAAALSWFGWRRVREARVALARRVALERQLAQTLAENRRLSLSHVRVQEDERKQLARELHDELGQHLNAIKIDAVAIRDWSVSATPGEIHRAALSIVSVANHVQDTIRDMLRRLRPAGLDELGLAAALENLVQQWQAHNPSTQAELAVDTGIDGLGENKNITCYRLVQEALNNVSRHAQAHHVHIQLACREHQLMLSIADDGAGAPGEIHATGLGLVGMRERVEALEGEFHITTATGQGFSIRAVMPIHGIRA